MSASESLKPSEALLLVIDVQSYFVPLMAGPQEPVIARIEYILALASLSDIPIIATFEAPVETKGWLPPRLERVFPDNGQRQIKHTFDCCSEPKVVEAIESSGKSHILVMGAETDVCVLQSVLGLLRRQKTVFLLEDCIFSGESNVGPAIRRMERAGAISTTAKSTFYEIRGSVGIASPLAAMRERFPHASFPEPEELPVWSSGVAD